MFRVNQQTFQSHWDPLMIECKLAGVLRCVVGVLPVQTAEQLHVAHVHHVLSCQVDDAADALIRPLLPSVCWSKRSCVGALLVQLTRVRLATHQRASEHSAKE